MSYRVMIVDDEFDGIFRTAQMVLSQYPAILELWFVVLEFVIKRFDL